MTEEQKENNEKRAKGLTICKATIIEVGALLTKATFVGEQLGLTHGESITLLIDELKRYCESPEFAKCQAKDQKKKPCPESQSEQG